MVVSVMVSVMVAVMVVMAPVMMGMSAARRSFEVVLVRMLVIVRMRMRMIGHPENPFAARQRRNVCQTYDMRKNEIEQQKSNLYI